MARMSKEEALEAIDKVIKQVEKTKFNLLLILMSRLMGGTLPIEVKECMNNIDLLIGGLFGLNSAEFKEFKELEKAIISSKGEYDLKKNVETLKSFLRSIKFKIETFGLDEISKEENVKKTKELSKPTEFSDKKIFIIHGHDEGTKEKVARFLMQLNLNPIILHEKPNEGNTIIEKFEKHSLDAGFAIALLTPDDVGNSKVNKYNLNYRARQNVILELGYFMGKLGRKRVCALLSKDVEIPSDYSGILYIPLEEETWKLKLAKELQTVGFKIDMNLI